MMKNRTQNFNDFFACLQREYLVAELRYKIYMKVKDKEYYLHKEMEGKKKTIESIASRNNFPSIFTDQWLLEKYKSEIYNAFIGLMKTELTGGPLTLFLIFIEG